MAMPVGNVTLFDHHIMILWPQINFKQMVIRFTKDTSATGLARNIVTLVSL